MGISCDRSAFLQLNLVGLDIYIPTTATVICASGDEGRFLGLNLLRLDIRNIPTLVTVAGASRDTTSGL